MTKRKPNARYFRGSVEDRLKFYSEPSAHGCIFWTGVRNIFGYGQIWDGSRLRYAHVVAYELVNGSVPKGLELDHRCNVSLCVNPDHLKPVTRRENIMRGLAPAVVKARYRAVTHCKHGHEFTPDNTYITKVGRRSCRACHAMHEEGRRRLRLLSEESTFKSA